jgi:hypothetical protein
LRNQFLPDGMTTPNYFFYEKLGYVGSGESMKKTVSSVQNNSFFTHTSNWLKLPGRKPGATFWF